MIRLRCLAAIAVLVITAACSAPVTASMTMTAEPADGVVHVRGHADLPEGARLRVWGWNEGVAATGDLTSSFLPGLPVWVDVADGQFATSLDSSRWPSGTSTLVVSFVVDNQQPQKVVDRFGANGERLHGPQTREDTDGYRILEAEAQVTL